MVATTIRIEEELYNKIVKLSIEERRSINAEILYIIEQYLKLKEHSEQKSKEKVNA